MDALMKRRDTIRRLLTVTILLLVFVPFAIAAEFWGSKNSNKYHYPDCRWAQRTKPSNLIKFKSPEDAQKAGYVPCEACKPPVASKPSLNSFVDAPDLYLCTRVVDGDTIIVKIGSKKERVRLIGVDTPETKHPKKSVQYFGKEASVFTKRMVESKKVRLEYDWQKRDKYGRLLAYVYLEDGTFLNAEIIRRGYGFAYTRFPFKYLDEFRRYEREARENNRGLWNK